jgi:hypothetical protein
VMIEVLRMFIALLTTYNFSEDYFYSQSALFPRFA